MADNAYVTPSLLGSDTVDMQAGIFSRLGDAATKGVYGAAVSGGLSIVNTFLDYTGQEAIDTAKTIRDFDEDYGNYYEENKDIIDLGGFVATSIVPGMLGVKALKLARTGEALGPISRALNFAATPAQRNLAKGLEALGRSGGTLTAEVQSAKRARLAWETADQVLVSAATELGVLAMMNDSPIFENDTAADFVKNIVIGSVFGGAIGGVFSAFETRGIMKAAGRQIEAGQRTFDVVSDPAKYGLKKADEILTFTENLLKLPDNFYDINFSYKLGKKTHYQGLPTSEAFKKSRTGAEKLATEQAKIKFNELAQGAENTGNAMFEFIAKKMQEGREAGHSAETIADTIGGYLQGVKSISSLDFESASVEAPKQFFVNLKPKHLGDMFSDVRGTSTGKKAYYLTTTDPRQIKSGSMERLGYGSVGEAFEDGYDMVYNKAGFVSINPKSKVIKNTPDMALKNDFYMDLETGSLTPDIVLTGGDILKKAGDFKAFKDSVTVSGKHFSQVASKSLDLNGSALEASTRFMWASSDALTDASFKKMTIEWNDFPLLDRAKGIAELALDSDTAIRMPDGSLQKFIDLVNIPEFVNELKLQALRDQLDTGPQKWHDVRHIQAHLNVSREWFETGVANNFAVVPEQLKEARSLSTYFKPQTVKMQWDSEAMQVARPDAGFVGPAHLSNYTLGHHYQLQTNKRTELNAFESAFGEDAKRFQEADDALIGGVRSTGSGAGEVTASNADYGDRTGLFVQDTGKATSLTQQKWRDADIKALSPHINAIRDSKEAAAELGILTTALRRDPAKYYLDHSGDTARLVDREAYKLLEKHPNDFQDLDAAILHLQDGGKKGSYAIQNIEVGDFFQASRDINKVRLNKMTTLTNALGLGRTMDDMVIYAPPVDTRRYPFFAFVRAKEKIGNHTDLSMITAKSSDELRSLANQVGDEYEVIYNDQTKRFFEAKGQYDYSLAINESRVNSDLQRRGIRGDFFPETRAQNVLEDYVQWHGNSSDHLVRTGVQVKNRQLLADIDFLSTQYRNVETSTVNASQRQASKIADPYDDYRKTMLNISKQSEYPILDKLNEFTDSIAKKMYSALDSVRNDVFEKSEEGFSNRFASLEYTNKLMADAGIGTEYQSIEQILLANERYPKNAIKEAVQKVNYWLATTTLRLDLANSIVNIISTPIMLGTEWSSIKRLVADDSELAGKLRELTHVKVPGQDQAVPSLTKTIYNASKAFWGPEKEALIKRFTDNGDIKGIASLYHEVHGDLAYRPGQEISKFKAQIDAAVEKGSKITGNDFAEEFTRFVSAHSMLQLTDPLVAAGRMTIKEQNAYISSFVNRVQGNYIYSQRPVAFQGTVGAAISLFQTYSFNVLQQLTRHMENGDKKTLAVFGGLQGMIYGLNGLPMFDAINTHLIGSLSSNPQHRDAYSELTGKELGDWMLFGTASAFPLFGNKSPALFSRGDINPRNVALLPLLPQDVPAVQASIKLVGSITGFAKQVGGGADVSTSFLQALEHQGWSRPLAGFAQLLAGESTTSKGSLISAANDLETTTWLSRIPDRLVNYGGVSRLMGARPMDEAISLNAINRIKAYDALDRQRIEALGQVVKTKLGNNQMPDDEELHGFMQSYVNSGGRQETFSSSMQRWSRDANESIVNQLSKKMGSQTSRRYQDLLGGEQMRDYTSMGGMPPLASEAE